MPKRLNRTPVPIRIGSTTVATIPCSHLHRERLENGLLVLSCQKCVIEWDAADLEVGVA